MPLNINNCGEITQDPNDFPCAQEDPCGGPDPCESLLDLALGEENRVMQQMYVNDYLRRILETDSIDPFGAAEDFLNDVGNENAYKTLVAIAIEQGDLEMAEQYLDSVPFSSSEQIQFHNYYNILIDLKEIYGSSVPDSLTSAQVASLYNIVNSKAIVSTQAENLLALYDKGIFDYEILPINVESRIASEEVVDENRIINEEKQWTISPNPTSGIVHIELTGFDSETTFSVRLYNMLGELILNSSSINSTQIEVDMSSLKSSIYYCQIIANDSPVTTERIVIAK